MDKGTYKTILPPQRLLGNNLPIQIPQHKRAPNLWPSNALAHLRDPLPSQPLLFHLEVHDHAPASHHEQQRRLPRERARRVARAQLAHRFRGGVCCCRRECATQRLEGFGAMLSLRERSLYWKGSGGLRWDAGDWLANGIGGRSTGPSGEYPGVIQTGCHCVDCSVSVSVLRMVWLGGLRRVNSAVTWYQN